MADTLEDLITGAYDLIRTSAVKHNGVEPTELQVAVAFLQAQLSVLTSNTFDTEAAAMEFWRTVHKVIAEELEDGVS